MKVKVGVSNRHVHLTEDTYAKLFPGKNIEKRNDLNQVGEYERINEKFYYVNDNERHYISKNQVSAESRYEAQLE